MNIGYGGVISAMNGASIVVNRAVKLQAPNTVELYIKGKYSAVTKQQRLNPLEIPNLVNSTQTIITQTFVLSGRNIRGAANAAPNTNERMKVFLEPIYTINKPEIK